MLRQQAIYVAEPPPVGSASLRPGLPLESMDLHRQRQPLAPPGGPEADGALASLVAGDGQGTEEVIEHLRLKVPAAARQAWLEAEQASWEPWLRTQMGFLGRELHWDEQREEGQLLIRWASRDLWQAIPAAAVEQVQQQFERSAHAALARLGVPLSVAAVGDAAAAGGGTVMPPAQLSTNPFPLVYAGELEPDALP